MVTLMAAYRSKQFEKEFFDRNFLLSADVEQKQRFER
jgi:hypothetical protein